VSEETIQKILKEETNAVYLATGKRWKFEDLLTIAVDIEFVVRFQRKNDVHTVSNKTFDFSKTTIQKLIQDGYLETKEQLKEVLAKLRELNVQKKYVSD
jgi:NTE family protein